MASSVQGQSPNTPIRSYHKDSITVEFLNHFKKARDWRCQSGQYCSKVNEIIFIPRSNQVSKEELLTIKSLGVG